MEKLEGKTKIKYNTALAELLHFNDVYGGVNLPTTMFIQALSEALTTQLVGENAITYDAYCEILHKIYIRLMPMLEIKQTWQKDFEDKEN